MVSPSVRLLRPFMVAALVLAVALAGCASQHSNPKGPTGTPAPTRGDVFAPVGDPGAQVGDLPLVASVRIVATGQRFYEPTIAVLADGTLAVCCPQAQSAVGSLLFGSPATMVSRDGGATWTVAHVQQLGSYDPMLALDPITHRIYEFNMFQVNCSNLAFSDDAGATWTERPLSCGAVPVFDFLKVAAGRAGPEPNPLAVGESVVYQCRNVNHVQSSSWCTVSYDGGLTWPVDQSVAVRSIDGCGGVTSWPAVAPDGVAVLPVGNGCSTFTMGVSRNSGITWSIAKFPGDLGMVSVTPQAAFDDAGHLYILWQDFGHRMNLARSDDFGATWSGPWNVTPPGARSHVFEALQAGAEGRLAFAFFAGAEEPEDGGGIASVPDDMPWHLFVGTVEGGHTNVPGIALYRASPLDDPVQVGPVCFGGGACPRNHGDFFSAATAPDGTFHLAFVDGCVDDCAGNPEATSEDSRQSAGRIAVLDGWRLR